MLAEPQVRYFLGANSPHGFYSLYEQLIDPARAESIYIFKGGAGCGKSSLMKKTAKQMEAAGFAVEYICCSGDIYSLDAILIPEKRAALVDGTAPHIIEPKYPGLVEQYVNLGRCYDVKALKPLRREIMDCAGSMKDCYSRAYRCLNAAAGIEEDQRAVLITPALEEHISRRTKGIVSREIKGKVRPEAPGAVKQRFLSAVTHEGQVCLFDTVDALCKRVYALMDSYGLAHLMLTQLLAAAIAEGHDAVACPSPMAPDRLEHLIIPGLSLAFVTSSPAMPYLKRPARRLRLDAMADSELLRRNKPRIRFSKKVTAALLEEAVSSLDQAKSMHDKLEQLYNPHVDFTAVYAIGDEIIAALMEK